MFATYIYIFLAKITHFESPLLNFSLIQANDRSLAYKITSQLWIFFALPVCMVLLFQASNPYPYFYPEV